MKIGVQDLVLQASNAVIRWSLNASNTAVRWSLNRISLGCEGSNVMKSADSLQVSKGQFCLNCAVLEVQGGIYIV